MYSKAVTTVAHNLGMTPKEVQGAYLGFWRFIRAHIQSLPLKEDLSEDEFSKLKTNFNIPSLGKLACTYDRYTKVKKSKNYEGNISKES